MAERDPRVDPKPGDQFRGDKSERYVGRVDADGAVGFTCWSTKQATVTGVGNDCFALADAVDNTDRHALEDDWDLKQALAAYRAARDGNKGSQA